MRPHNKSEDIFRRALQVIPGGVNSPVRAFRSVGMTPVVMERGSGSRIWDADQNEYIDYVLSWGPLILGHCHPAVIEALQGAMACGTTFGASTERELELALLIRDAFPSVEKVRLVNSGTEATMSAIRVARGYTGRDMVVKFEGCYHGHVDALLVQAGSGVATLGIPETKGIPEDVVRHTLALPFNDAGALHRAFEQWGPRIACVIVEPVVGNMGCVPPAPGYLEEMRDLTRQNRAVLIFDEVMTGFRLSYGGAQQLLGIVPDMTTLGKVIGGGLPVGAYGGRADIMNMVAPEGPVYQAGTLSGNPLAVAAGIAMLHQLRDGRAYAQMERLGARLVDGVTEKARAAGVPLTVNRRGSMFTFFFSEHEVTDYESAAKSDKNRFAVFFGEMLERGVYLPPSQFEAAFLSAVHTEKDIEATARAAGESFEAVARAKAGS